MLSLRDSEDGRTAPIFWRVETFINAAQENIAYGFFGRRGGVSKGVYNALNCGPGSEDDLECVIENRKRVLKILGGEALNTLYQVHGSDCLNVDKAFEGPEPPKADALVTDRPGLALGILTADCAPVLFYGEKKDGAPVIGAAHAGWKGALAGVLENCAGRMKELGAVDGSIKACIGPCIAQRSYEVGQDFYDQFVAHPQESTRFFKEGETGGHYYFDLPGFCAHRLYLAGLTRISVKDLDTYFNEEEFFSYRRATHRDEKDYGRQISAIMIKA